VSGDSSWDPEFAAERRRQGFSHPKLSADSAGYNPEFLSDFVLFFNWSQNGAKVYKSEPAEICLKSLAASGLAGTGTNRAQTKLQRLLDRNANRSGQIEF